MDRLGCHRAGTGKHMRQHRGAAEFVQHLGLVAVEAGAFASGQDDDRDFHTGELSQTRSRNARGALKLLAQSANVTFANSKIPSLIMVFVGATHASPTKPRAVLSKRLPVSLRCECTHKGDACVAPTTTLATQSYVQGRHNPIQHGLPAITCGTDGTRDAFTRATHASPLQHDARPPNSPEEDILAWGKREHLWIGLTAVP